jgi:endonuclease I
MKIFIVLHEIDWEGFTIIDVFTNEEDADAFMLWMNGGSRRPRGDQRYAMMEWDTHTLAEAKAEYQ